jgi:hypothetical protein
MDRPTCSVTELWKQLGFAGDRVCAVDSGVGVVYPARVIESGHPFPGTTPWPTSAPSESTAASPTAWCPALESVAAGGFSGQRRDRARRCGAESPAGPGMPIPCVSYLPVRSRCAQPGQQQGRRIPSSSSSWVRRMRRSRVADCFASSTQQMNSFRASGVMSFHAFSAVGFSTSAVRMSAGSLCTTPPGTRSLAMPQPYRGTAGSFFTR